MPKVKYFSSQIKSRGIQRIIQKTGIDKKYKAKNNEYATDIAVKAVEKIFYKNLDLKKKN